jgi:SAM-dependent methyltransferase
VVDNRWLESEAGRALLQQERGQVARALDRVFGDQIVQISVWGPSALFTEVARTQVAFLVDVNEEPGVNAAMAPNRLAILTDSIDAVFLPHTLERDHDPHGVLREVHRILRPDGKVIILGFNPFSWWGLRHRLSPRGFPRGLLRQITKRRLSDWLTLLNLTIETVYPCYASGAKGRGMQLIHQLQLFASSYILVASKETIPMTIIRPRARRRTRLVESLVNPTTRNVA